MMTRIIANNIISKICLSNISILEVFVRTNCYNDLGKEIKNMAPKDIILIDDSDYENTDIKINTSDDESEKKETADLFPPRIKNKIINLSIYPNPLWKNTKLKYVYDFIVIPPPDEYMKLSDLFRLGKLKQFHDLLGRKTFKKISFNYSESESETDSELIKKLENIKINNLNEVKEISKNLELHMVNNKNILELKEAIDSFEKNRYHIIYARPDVSKRILYALKTYFVENNKYEIIEYFDIKHLYITEDHDDITNIYNLFDKRPRKQIIILINKPLHYGICKRYLGVLYDYMPSSINNGDIIKGMVAHLTGYNYNNESICFTNLYSVITYENMINNNFNDLTSWNISISKKIKCNSKIISIMKELKKSCTYVEFTSFSNLKKYFVDKVIDTTVDNFHLISMHEFYMKSDKINKSEAMKILKSDVKKNNFHYSYVMFYKNINDSKSRIHLLAHLTYL